MNIIGQGLQYTVYDMGDGRVLKKLNSKLEQESVLRSWGYTKQEDRDNDIASIDELTETSNNKIQSLLQQNILPAHFLGNPIFINASDYTQDKAIVVGPYYNEHSLEENKVMIEKYISLTHELWQYGIADTIFNFTVNNGVTNNGDVIQLDFGECTFELSEISQLIKDQLWLTKQSYKSLEDDPIAPFIAMRLKQEFTIDTLNRLWQQKLHTS